MATFTLGNKTSEELGITLLADTSRTLASAPKSKQLDIANRAGVYSYPGKASPKLFELECEFDAKSRAELETLKDELISHLTDEYGEPRVVDLSFSDSDKIWRVRYNDEVALDMLIDTAQFSLPLLAFEGYAYTPAKRKSFTVTTVPEVFANIEDSGNAPSEPIIKIKNNGDETISYLEIVRTLFE